MKLVTVVGARPQFVKAAVVSRAVAEHNAAARKPLIEEIIVHTGQHYDSVMSDVFFKEMKIPDPHYNLRIGGGTHGAMTGQMLEKIEEVLMKEKPDAVLVYGDTNSTLAGALAAAKLHIPIAHVEAGLRSYNRRMPEEINRILTDQISRWLFCPSDEAVTNLNQEGIGRGNAIRVTVENVGDVMYDAVLFYKRIARPSPETAVLLDTVGAKYYLATIHRAENTDDMSRLQEILQALEQISCHTPVILPLHPRTANIIRSAGMDIRYVRMIQPVGYFDMLSLLGGCQGAFTDSGGLQKEAYFFRKPCVTMRSETEWVELVRHGFNELTDASCQKILEAEQRLSTSEKDWGGTLYGDGNAGRKILDVLCGL